MSRSARTLREAKTAPKPGSASKQQSKTRSPPSPSPPPTQSHGRRPELETPCLAAGRRMLELLPARTRTHPSMFLGSVTGFLYGTRNRVGGERTPIASSSSSSSSSSSLASEAPPPSSSVGALRQYENTWEVSDDDVLTAGEWTVDLRMAVDTGTFSSVYDARHSRFPERKFVAKMGALNAHEIATAMYMGACGVGPRVYDVWETEGLPVSGRDYLLRWQQQAMAERGEGKGEASDFGDEDGGGADKDDLEAPVFMVMERARGATLDALMIEHRWPDVSYAPRAVLQKLYDQACEMAACHVRHADFHVQQIVVGGVAPSNGHNAAAVARTKSSRVSVSILDWDRAEYLAAGYRRSVLAVFGEFFDEGDDQVWGAAKKRLLAKVKPKARYAAAVTATTTTAADSPVFPADLAKLDRAELAHLLALNRVDLANSLERLAVAWEIAGVPRWREGGVKGAGQRSSSTAGGGGGEQKEEKRGGGAEGRIKSAWETERDTRDNSRIIRDEQEAGHRLRARDLLLRAAIAVLDRSRGDEQK